jgi:3-hydroxybutyrate dehydrogenase
MSTQQPLKVVIVGATTGLGESLSLSFKKAQYHVTGIGRTVSVNPIHDQFIITDLNGDIPETVLELNDIDVLIYNAGVSRRQSLGESGFVADHHEIMAINYFGFIKIINALSDRLKSGGSVIAITSLLSTQGMAGYSAYVASKHALLGAVRALALELAERKITVNAIAPAWVETPMLYQTMGEMAESIGVETKVMVESEKAASPFGRFIQPDEVSAMALYLASDHARMITGQSFVINGGF